jgi:hypothetical protein
MRRLAAGHFHGEIRLEPTTRRLEAMRRALGVGGC